MPTALTALKVRELMTENPVVCATTDNLYLVAHLMEENEIGCIPVVDIDHKTLLGLVTDRDIVCRAAAAGQNLAFVNAGNVMTKRNLVTARPDDDIDVVIQKMISNQVRRVPVVDKGKLLGMISSADVAIALDGCAEAAELLKAVSEKRTLS